jgi:hypothetical protein
LRRSILTTLACAPFLAAASCQTVPAVTEPADVLVCIPKAPPAVNAILVAQARPTATGLARHIQRTDRYGCDGRKPE